jgi:hypothetical protein
MTANMKILTIVIGACVLIGLGFVPLFHDPAREAAAHAETARVFKEIENEYAMDIAKQRYRLMVLRYGEDFADELFRCTSDPPKHRENQERCRKMAARVQRDDAEAEAREKRDRDNW